MLNYFVCALVSISSSSLRQIYQPGFCTIACFRTYLDFVKTCIGQVFKLHVGEGDGDFVTHGARDIPITQQIIRIRVGESRGGNDAGGICQNPSTRG